MREIIINNKPVKIWTNSVDEKAMRQIQNLAKLPYVYHHLAFMPDVHAGMGMPIGGVMACKDVVVPNAVGVDIGCGMCAVKTNWRVDDIPAHVIRKEIINQVKRCIPLGNTNHKRSQGECYLPQGYDVEKMTIVRERILALEKEVGTLGGGNHFIEFQKDEENYLWVMLHSGSRNLGVRVCEFYNDVARQLNERMKCRIPLEVNMAFLPAGSMEFKSYWQEMNYCIDFAFCNRQLMMNRIKDVLCKCLKGIGFEPMINIAHNYASWESHYGQKVIVHRKGATLAEKGVIGIIPGSQGTASYIVEGLGNPASFNSCSHGAGRSMSRTQAIKTLSMAREVTMLEAKGIIHSIRTQDDMQEASAAYKDIETVISNESDLVRIKKRLLPVAIIKA